MSAIWAVVPAAGSGSRMSRGEAKQYRPLLGRTLLDWSVGALLAHSELRGVMVALPADDVGRHQKPGADDGSVFTDHRVRVCAGGASRAASVAAGLEALKELDAQASDWVLVHDAARPCLALSDLQSLVEQVTLSGVGGILALPVADTLKRGDTDARITATVDREGIWQAQTPQMFRLGELSAALEAARKQGLTVTDEASAMEAAKFPVQLVRGSVANLKVTYAADMSLATFWLQQLYSQSADMAGRKT